MMGLGWGLGGMARMYCERVWEYVGWESLVRWESLVGVVSTTKSAVAFVDTVMVAVPAAVACAETVAFTCAAGTRMLNGGRNGRTLCEGLGLVSSAFAFWLRCA